MFHLGGTSYLERATFPKNVPCSQTQTFHVLPLWQETVNMMRFSFCVASNARRTSLSCNSWRRYVFPFEMHAEQ